MALSLIRTLSLGLGAIAYPYNIKNVVVLVRENRSIDTLAGGLTYNPANISQPNSQDVCAAGIAKNIASDDPRPHHHRR